jgi:hypothetical protein
MRPAGLCSLQRQQIVAVLDDYFSSRCKAAQAACGSSSARIALIPTAESLADERPNLELTVAIPSAATQARAAAEPRTTPWGGTR